MLVALSGAWHEVVTGIWLVGPAAASPHFVEIGDDAVTRMKFRRLSPQDITDYLDSHEWLDKAGAYAIQGYGRNLVETVDGDFENVVGLPTKLIHGLLSEHFRHCFVL